MSTWYTDIFGTNYTLPDYIYYLAHTPISVTPLFTNSAESRNLANLDPSQFTGSAMDALGGSDTVTLPATLAKWQAWGQSAVPDFHGGAGNDTITGGALADRIFGDAGVDTLRGGENDDLLVGGISNDILDGGTDLYGKTTPAKGDTARFAGAFLTSVWADPENLDSDNVVRVATAGDGTDTLTDVERGDFGGKMLPLVKWTFQIDRVVDGRASVTLFEDGVNTGLTTKVSALNLGAAYDEVTPVRMGEYAAVYRTNGANGVAVPGGATRGCIELSDLFGQTTDTATHRTALQLHKGDSPGDSEGCVVMSSASLIPMLQHIQARIGDAAIVGTTDKIYQLPIPITVDYNGAIKQPVLQLDTDGKVGTAIPAAPKLLEGTSAKIYVDIMEGTGANNIFPENQIHVYFRVAEGAGFAKVGTSLTQAGVDFKFGPGVEGSPVATDTFSTVNKAGGAALITLPKGTYMVTLHEGQKFTEIPIQLRASDGVENEKIRIDIVDIDLLRNNGTQWKMFSESWDDTTKASGFHTVESQLFGAGARASLQFDVTDAPAAPAGTGTLMAASDLAHHDLDFFL